MFYNVPGNIVICINNDTNEMIIDEFKNKLCYIIYCNNDWKLKQKKLINNKCIDNCYNDTIYKYEYNNTSIENYDLLNEIICTENKPFEYNNKCIKNCDINDIINNKCILNYKNNKKEDIFIKNIDIGFTSDNYNTSDIDNGEETIIKYANMTIQ